LKESFNLEALYSNSYIPGYIKFCQKQDMTGAYSNISMTMSPYR